MNLILRKAVLSIKDTEVGHQEVGPVVQSGKGGKIHCCAPERNPTGLLMGKFDWVLDPHGSGAFAHLPGAEWPVEQQLAILVVQSVDLILYRRLYITKGKSQQDHIRSLYCLI